MRRPLSFLAASLLAAAIGVSPAGLTATRIAHADPAPGVTPTSVTNTLPEGSSFLVPKSVQTPAIPPQPDIVLLSDTTGSMGPAIANVQANASAITSSVLSSQPNAEFAVAEYKDDFNCVYDPFAYRLDQAMTGNQTSVQNGINQWVAGAGQGCDIPEQQLNALYTLATSPATGFRPGSTRIVVWFGDAAGHDPSYGHSLGDVIAALQAANITVLAVPISDGSGSSLDATHQATAIATATGGQVLPSATPAQLSNTIISGLHNLPVTVTPSVTCDPGMSLSFDQSGVTLTSGGVANFSETVSISAGATPGSTLTCTVDWLLNGKSTGDPAFVETITNTLPRHTTQTTYQGATSEDFNDPATLSAQLIDSVTNTPVIGATLQFALDGQSCTGVTDATGTASCVITPNEPAGNYPVSVSYAGDGQRQPSSDSATFTVNREESAVTSTSSLQVLEAGIPVTLSATLSDPDGGAPIGGKPVTITLGSGSGAQACTGTTDATGVATCSVTPTSSMLGPQPISDSFAGDEYYVPASHGQNALVFAFLQSGSFVLGDKTANAALASVPAGSVNWWGAQWSRNNALLSGLALPGAMKGFAANLSAQPPTCGGSYTTDPGNSTPPPTAGAIPSYMGVIVSSAQTKSGSMISGNIVKIVVVKTDAGYDGNPGHAGTGTVVATYCG